MDFIQPDIRHLQNSTIAKKCYPWSDKQGKDVHSNFFYAAYTRSLVGAISKKETLKHIYIYIYILKEKVKLSLITEDIIIYAENPKNLHKKPTRTKWLTKMWDLAHIYFFKSKLSFQSNR